MVPVLAKMAVLHKLTSKTSVMLGNYEMAYACGILSKIADIEVPVYDSPKELLERLLVVAEHYRTEDERQLNLLRMLKVYIPDTEWNQQMEELFLMGLQEGKTWS